MKAYPIHDPDGKRVGTVYEYGRRYYHTTKFGTMHGPWDTASRALENWCKHHYRDPRYFALREPLARIDKEARLALAEQRKHYYAYNR